MERHAIGAPQGGVVSPVLSNIYLHKLDDFAGNTLIPEYTRGETRTRNKEYERVRHAYRRARKSGNHEKARELRRRQAFLPSVDCADPGYRRLHYARYADDTLFGFTGPKAEAEEIKQRLTTFLRDELHLELSAEKTLITHARTGAAKFLGYEITTQHSGTSGRKRINGSIALRVPATVIKAKCAPYLERGKPAAQRALQNLGDYNIVAAYGAKYRGISQYYLLAGDVHRLNRLRWVMETSLLKTLAAKHDSTVSKMAARYKATIETPHGPRTCFEAVRIREGNQKPLVARFGGIPLKRRKTAVIIDRAPGRDPYPRKEIITRLQRNRCELCQHSGQVQVHHVARLADLAYPGHRPASMGQAHGSKATQVPRGLPALSRPDPCRTATSRNPSHGVSHQRAGCRETGTSGSAGGRTEKDPRTAGTSPYGLPNRPWRPKSCRRRRLTVDIVAGCRMRSLLILGSRPSMTRLTVTAMTWLPISASPMSWARTVSSMSVAGGDAWPSCSLTAAARSWGPTRPGHRLKSRSPRMQPDGSPGSRAMPRQFRRPVLTLR